MKVMVKQSGFKQLDKALAMLPETIAKGALRRTLLAAGKPIAEAASSMAPVETGQLKSAIAVSTKGGNDVGKAEYSKIMKGGGSKSAALAGMRTARRNNPNGAYVVAFVGPRRPRSKKEGIKNYVQEFGSKKQSPNPYMRPAFESEKGNALSIIRRQLGIEIIAAAKRLSRSKTRTFEEKSSAAIGALMAHEIGEG